MKIRLRLQLFCLAILLGAPARAHAQSTAFTYHGRLSDSGIAVTGAYDFQFTIFDSSGGTGIIAALAPVNNLGVTNGLFTTRLDPGAGVFTGPGRWLEIRVRPSSGGSFQTLSPRQELTSSPYSIRALTAGTATDVSNGSVVKSLNGLRDNISLVAGANVTLTPNGNALTIASSGTGGGSVWSLNGNNVYYSAGNVGIGISTPAHRLTVSGGPTWTANGWLGSIELEDAAAIGWRANATGQRFGMGHSGGGFFLFRTASDPGTIGSLASYDFMVSDAGNVGIGTTTPARKLTIQSPGFGLEHTDGTVRLGTYLSADGFNTDGGWLGTISNHKLHFFVKNGDPSMTVTTAGEVGIGTTVPVTRFTVAGMGVYNALGAAAITLRNDAAAGRRWGWHALDDGKMQIADYTAAATRLLIDTAGNVGIGVAAPQTKLDVDGTTRTKVLTITGGADIAEPFPFSSANIAKGSVVIIDERNPGQLKLSTEAYDTRVAGIVSGANGIRPGISLQQDGALEGGENVALSGRVYVLAEATSGAIKPGDLLTTSKTPGHAMKVTEHGRAQGAILGKAMSTLKEGKGMVLVLVTLQ
jgi:hypothetical protein